jgi:hypothetical protein
MHRRCYPTHQLLYGPRERETKEAPRTKATTAPRRAEALLGAARPVAGGRGARSARLQPQAGRRIARRQRLDDRPSRRADAEHREDTWGQRLIPRAELQRFLREHLEPPREPGARGSAGRPPTLPRRVASSSGSVCSTQADTASPRSPAPSTTTVSRPPTAAGDSGRRRSGLCSSARARSPPPM